MKKQEKKKSVKFQIYRLQVVLLTVAMAAVSVFAPARLKAAEDQDYAFYALASSAASYYDQSKNPRGDFSFTDAEVTAGNAGGLLGYLDKNLTPGAQGTLRSNASNNSQAIALPGSLQDGASSTLDQGVLGYMYYGAALESMGLDVSGQNLSVGMVEKTISSLTSVMYMISSAATAAFGFVIQALRILNPFQFLAGNKGSIYSDGYIVNTGDTAPDEPQPSDIGSVGTIDTSDTEAALKQGTIQNSMLSGIADTVTNIFYNLQQLSWEIAVPLLTVLLIAGFLFMDKTRHLDRLKKYTIRIVFLVCGVPLLGSMYTSILNNLAVQLDWTNGSQAVAMQIGTVYSDFENWADQSNLNLPEGAIIEVQHEANKTPQYELKGISMAKFVYSINGFESNYDDSYSKWNDVPGDGNKTDLAHISNLLSRYITDATFTSADYESQYKSFSGHNTETLYNEIETLSDPYEFTEDGEQEGNVFVDPSKDAAQILTNGSIVSELSPDQKTLSIYSTNATPYGLSTLATYNFLNSTFDSAGVRVYSPQNSSNQRVALKHRSVTVAGENQAVQWINMLRVLLMIIAFAIVQIFYIMRILIKNTISGFKMLGQIPAALFGSLAGIARVVAYVISMIVQLLGGILIMELSGQIAAMLGTLDFQLLADQMMGRTGDAVPAVIGIQPVLASTGDTTGAILTGLLGILIYGAFIWFSARVAGRITDAVSKGMITMIDRWFNLSAHSDSFTYQTMNSISPNAGQPGVISRAAGNITAGMIQGKIAKNSSAESNTNSKSEQSSSRTQLSGSSNSNNNSNNSSNSGGGGGSTATEAEAVAETVSAMSHVDTESGIQGKGKQSLTSLEATKTSHLDQSKNGVGNYKANSVSAESASGKNSASGLQTQNQSNVSQSYGSSLDSRTAQALSASTGNYAHASVDKASMDQSVQNGTQKTAAQNKNLDQTSEQSRTSRTGNYSGNSVEKTNQSNLSSTANLASRTGSYANNSVDRTSQSESSNSAKTDSTQNQTSRTGNYSGNSVEKTNQSNLSSAANLASRTGSYANNSVDRTSQSESSNSAKTDSMQNRTSRTGNFASNNVEKNNSQNAGSTSGMYSNFGRNQQSRQSFVNGSSNSEISSRNHTGAENSGTSMSSAVSSGNRAGIQNRSSQSSQAVSRSTVGSDAQSSTTSGTRSAFGSADFNDTRSESSGNRAGIQSRSSQSSQAVSRSTIGSHGQSSITSGTRSAFGSETVSSSSESSSSQSRQRSTGIQSAHQNKSAEKNAGSYIQIDPMDFGDDEDFGSKTEV